jgi:hypothetical protein
MRSASASRKPGSSAKAKYVRMPAAKSTGTQSIQRSCSASRKRAEASRIVDTSPLRTGAPPSSSPETHMADAPNRQRRPPPALTPHPPLCYITPLEPPSAAAERQGRAPTRQ